MSKYEPLTYKSPNNGNLSRSSEKESEIRYLKQVIAYQQQIIHKLNQKFKEQYQEKQHILRKLTRVFSKYQQIKEHNQSLQEMFEQTNQYTSKVLDELNESQNMLTQKKETLELVVRELEDKQEEINMQKGMLEHTISELDDAYSNITDSIHYAKRIQEAMLPRIENIKAVFLDLFIYFQPRDIVSGDFYWFYQDGLKCVIAAVDCTGHGVPGAFMSMIGNNMLHEIVARRGILEVNQILDQLNLGIRKVLRQYETHNQDGMDIALCVIDQQTRRIEFAGAHNPIFYIQDGESQLIKGDRFPVGGDQYSDDRSFKKHVIPLKENTIFYIFSDGYQDQFGGPQGRKFMARRLRHVLFEIHHLPMEKQKRILARILKNWMKTSRQIDDVLIIGIKL